MGRKWRRASCAGETIILTHQLAISSDYGEKIRHFVKSGGKLIVDGLTFFYDENQFAVMQTGFPLLIYLDVPIAGEHTISFSMREDGFKMDKIILSKSYRNPEIYIE